MADLVAPIPVAAPVPIKADTSEAAIPPPPQQEASETLYIQNLNEKIKIPVLKSSLRGLFKSYGEVLDVVAHSNLRMRGQAFVSFESKEVAAKALKEVKGFPLYSKPMVRSLFLLEWISCADTMLSALANLICKDTIGCCG